MTKKESLSQRIRDKYPEIDIENEEVFFGRINDDYDAFDKEIGGFKQREKALTDMFTADPRAANFLMNWKKGGDPVVELVKLLGTDGLKDAIEDPEKLEEVAEANREYLERVAKSNEYEQEYKKNLASSLEAIENMQGDDEEIDEAVTWLMKMGRDASLGIVRPEDVKLAIKAINYDKDTSQASYEGEVRGRNSKILEKMRMAGNDGVAQLGSRTLATKTNGGASSIFDIAKEAR